MILTNCVIEFVIFYENHVFYSNLIKVMIIIISQLFLSREIESYLKNMLISKAMCISVNSSENSLMKDGKFAFFFIM